MKRDKSKPKFIMLRFLAAVVLALIVIVGLAMADDFKGSENIASASGLSMKVAKSLMLNKEITLNKDELNGMALNEWTKNGNISDQVKSLTLIPSSEEDIMYVYAQVDFLGRIWGVNAKTKVNLVDNNFEVDVLETHVGKLRVPRGMFLHKVKDKLNDKVTVENSKIYFSPDMKIDVLGVNVKFQFEKFKIANEQVAVKLNVQGDINLSIMKWLG